jgi:hypothetical protein
MSKPASSPYKEILWFERSVDGKPVTVVAEYHQEWIKGYVQAALDSKSSKTQAGPFRLRVKKGKTAHP